RSSSLAPRSPTSCIQCSGDPRDLPSFPTRRSSDLRSHVWQAADTLHNVTFPHPRSGDLYPIAGTWTRWVADSVTIDGARSGTARSEEHTSELQSLTNLVCRLLLEKKKHINPPGHST